MTGLEPRISGVGSDRSTNFTTTTTHATYLSLFWRNLNNVDRLNETAHLVEGFSWMENKLSRFTYSIIFIFFNKVMGLLTLKYVVHSNAGPLWSLG